MKSIRGGTIGRYLGVAVDEVASHRMLILIYLLLSMVVLAPCIAQLGGAAGPSISWACLYLALALCLLALISRAMYVLACILLLPPMLLQLHVGRHWGAGQLNSRIEAFYESPTGEIVEYLRSHVDAIDIALVVGSVVLVIGVILVLRRCRPASSAMRRIAGVALVAWALVAAGISHERSRFRFQPLQLAVDAFAAKQRFDQLSQRHERLSRTPFAEYNCRLRYKRIVIVLGESATSGHMSIFGYPKPTTPFAERSHPYAFDALSASNQTRYSLAMMLTGASPGAFESFFSSHSLVGQLRNCGMHTLWISNQGRRGEYDSFSTSLAQEADEQIFLNEWSWTEAQLDGRIVDELDKRGTYQKPNQATFIHLIGSHTDYNQRYPAGFGFKDLSDVVAQYDNSILYTDYVLSRLYERFAGESLLFLYVSDHGQIVSDGKFGSGFMPGYQVEFRTPLLIWTDDAAAMDTVRRAIGDSRLNLESLDDVIRFLVGMSPAPNVSTRPEVSVLTPEYVKSYGELATQPVD